MAAGVALMAAGAAVPALLGDTGGVAADAANGAVVAFDGLAAGGLTVGSVPTRKRCRG
ncbi:MAG: hypothetical protein IPO66_23045 [Rhodanobacteraceae bacterium]|nr:hypothetical protein [Rhodanobacteraceae bacterium]